MLRHQKFSNATTVLAATTTMEAQRNVQTSRDWFFYWILIFHGHTNFIVPKFLAGIGTLSGETGCQGFTEPDLSPLRYKINLGGN